MCAGIGHTVCLFLWMSGCRWKNCKRCVVDWILCILNMDECKLVFWSRISRMKSVVMRTCYGILKPRLHDTTGCQTGCQTVLTTGLTTVLNEQPLFVQPVVMPGCTTGLTTGCIHDTAVCQTGCQTGLTTGWMFVYTIQPIVKPVWQRVWQRVWQPVVSCIQTFTRLANRFDNWFGNRLYRVNGALVGRMSSTCWRITMTLDSVLYAILEKKVFTNFHNIAVRD